MHSVDTVPFLSFLMELSNEELILFMDMHPWGKAAVGIKGGIPLYSQQKRAQLQNAERKWEMVLKE